VAGSIPSQDIPRISLLYFSDLPVEHKDELLRDSYYLRIIKHEKFNPRLIEWLSSYRRLRNVPVAQYRAFVEHLLRDPSEIWSHAYERKSLTPDCCWPSSRYVVRAQALR